MSEIKEVKQKGVFCVSRNTPLAQNRLGQLAWDPIQP